MSRSASSTVAWTASRSSGKRAAASCGPSRTLSRVPAPLRLAALEGRAVLDRHEDVLEARAAQMVRVHVAGGDRADAEGLRERPERGVPASVAPLVGSLELDEEAVAAEGAGEAGGRVRIADGEPVPRAAGEADEALALAPRAAPGRGAGSAARGRARR